MESITVSWECLIYQISSRLMAKHQTPCSVLCAAIDMLVSMNASNKHVTARHRTKKRNYSSSLQVFLYGTAMYNCVVCLYVCLRTRGDHSYIYIQGIWGSLSLLT